MKKIFREISPPFLLRWWRARRQAVRWAGDYGSWAEAQANSLGYDEPANLARVREATRSVRDGRAVFERDGITFAEPEYVWPVLAGLQLVAAYNGGRLDVVDFGGSLGSTYHQHRGFLEALSSLRWRVVEQPAWVAAGRAEFTNARLSFHENLDEVTVDAGQQVLLLSSVLPYLSEPHKFLEDAIRRRFSWILIDRTGFLRCGAQDQLTVQTVRPPLFDASYPCWFFSEAGFLGHFSRDYDLKAAHSCADRANLDADFRGFLFRCKP